MRLALLGYGRMGKEVERVARIRGIEIVSIIDPNVKPGGIFHTEITKESVKDADVVIDFTSPSSAIANIKKVSSLKKNMVVGTTGWSDNLEEAKKSVKESKTGLIYSSNFSLGVNAYFMIVEQAAKIFNKLEEYDVYGYELHHNQKVDSPSGTAKTTADILLSNIARKKKLVCHADGKIAPHELSFGSVRAGSIPGTHVVGFDSDSDSIEIMHAARSRSGFALGSIMAAEWVYEKKGFFSMKDFMVDYLKK